MVVTSVIYTIHRCRHLQLKEQLSLIVQLHDRCVLSCSLLKIFELCCLIKFFTLGIVLSLILIVFNLKILLNLCDLGKCFLTCFRNTLSMFVLTFKPYGGLNHMIFLFLFCLEYSTGTSNFIL